MGNVVALNQQNVSLRIRLLTDSTGIPATSVVAATAGHEIWYQRDNEAVVTDATSAADLALLTTAHTDWGFLHIREGWYRIDLPDAAFVEGVGSVIVGMNATGITGLSQTIKIEALFKFHGLASSVTATTTTFPAGTDPREGDFIQVVAGTGIKQTRLVTSVAGQVATHLAWTTNISATTSTIALIAGDTTIGLGGENVDVLVSSRSSLGVADVKGEADQALVDANNVSANMVQTVGQALKGDGTDANKFRSTLVA